MMLRPYEKKEKTVFTGATWVFISALLIIAFFPKFIAVTALTILVISDISAALIGRKFGKTKFLGKSLEGTLAFFITGIMIIIVYGIIFHASWTYFLFGFISVIVGAFFESISKSIKLDDNFTIPLSISIFMWLGELISVYFNCSYANLI
jgi:dolichol kinase